MTHPYKLLPTRNFWNSSVSNVPWHAVFSAEVAKFQLLPTDAIVTAGSCFAQRISRHLKARQFGRLSFELPHPHMDVAAATSAGYDMFSARYGNIYTTRQLKQLVDEAFGHREPIFEVEQSKDGRFIDLLRPNINEIGFSSELEARADRIFHLKCVKDMFTQADVFIFTLGLTEAWSTCDGSVVYGTHPNVSTRRDVRSDAVAINLDYLDCYNDLVNTINFLRQINPKLKFVFTVSPVALAATHQDNHVAVATMYSKSVLRAVAGRVAGQLPYADYFMSYEIFNSPQSFGQFLSGDLREVSLRGVDAVMNLFVRMYCEYANDVVPAALGDTVDDRNKVSGSGVQTNAGIDVECEEILNSLFSRG